MNQSSFDVSHASTVLSASTAKETFRTAGKGDRSGKVVLTNVTPPAGIGTYNCWFGPPVSTNAAPCEQEFATNRPLVNVSPSAPFHVTLGPPEHGATAHDDRFRCRRGSNRAVASLPMITPTQSWDERQPVAMRVLPDKVHYAWWIVAGAAALMFVTIGVGYYGLAVFLRPLQEENGWSNAIVSGATGWFFVLGGITGFVIGPGVDRRGPLRYINAGVVLMVVSVSSLMFISEVWHLYLAYTGQALAFGLSGAVAINALMSRWFVTRRAWAMSITFTGISLGGMVLAPVGTWLIERGGVQLAAPILAALVAVVALPMSLFVLVGDPASVGLGVDADAPNESVQNVALSDEVQLRAWTRAEAMRTSSFWAISIAFVIVLLAQTGFLVHQIAFLEDRLGSRNAAALALSTTAFGSIVARLVVGRFADGMDKRLLTVTIIVIQGLAVLGATLIDNRVTTYVFVLIVGFTIGNVYMLQTLMTAEIFGLVSLGAVLGTMTLMSQIGSGLGPFLVGWAEDVTDSYRTPFVVTGLATIAAALLILLARPIALDPAHPDAE